MGAKRVEGAMAKPRVPHPGCVLLQDWLDPCGISQNDLARQMKLSPRRVNEIILGKRGISADTALRLGEMLGLDPRYWLNLQMEYELDQATLPHDQRARKLPAPKGTFDGARPPRPAQRTYDGMRHIPLGTL